MKRLLGDDSKKTNSTLTRRRFLETTVGTVVGGSLLPYAWAAESRNGIPYRTLGNTGERVSCIGLGGYHLGNQSDEQESIRIIRSGLDEGINFLDNCWDYNGGESEVRMGKALRDGYRQKAFLMTKIDGRTKKGSAKQIDESSAPAANRSSRPAAVPRGDPRHRPRSDFCPRRRNGGGGRSQRKRESPLHRIHRTQEPGHSPQDARDGIRPRTSP